MSCSNSVWTYTLMESVSKFASELVNRLQNDVLALQHEVVNAANAFQEESEMLSISEPGAALDACAIKCIAHIGTYEKGMADFNALVDQVGEMEVSVLAAVIGKAPQCATFTQEQLEGCVTDQFFKWQEWQDEFENFQPYIMRVFVSETVAFIREGYSWHTNEDVDMTDDNHPVEEDAKRDDAKNDEDEENADEEVDEKEKENEQNNEEEEDWEDDEMDDESTSRYRSSAQQEPSTMAEVVEKATCRLISLPARFPFARDGVYLFNCSAEESLEAEAMETCDVDEIERQNK